MVKLKYRKLYPREYRIWKAMRARCSAPSFKDSIYGTRGIKVCDRWKSFDSFFEDMGECPEGYSIDRIDTYGDYEPNNCRWASTFEQSKNRGSFNRNYTYGGKTMCLKDWSKELGIKYTTLIQRMARHPEFSFEDAITYKDPNTQPIEYDGVLYTRQELCEKYNIPIQTFYDRYHKNWPIERIINTPLLKSRYDERNYFANRKTESK